MEIEASRYSAEFVRKPIKPAEFLEDRRALPGRRATPAPLAAQARRRRLPRDGGGPAGRGASSVGYGGLRLELPSTASMPPQTFDVEVAGIGLQLEVEPVWSYPAPGGDGARLRRGARGGHHACRPHLARHRRSPAPPDRPPHAPLSPC